MAIKIMKDKCFTNNCPSNLIGIKRFTRKNIVFIFLVKRIFTCISFTILTVWGVKVARNVSGVVFANAFTFEPAKNSENIIVKANYWGSLSLIRINLSWVICFSWKIAGKYNMVEINAR